MPFGHFIFGVIGLVSPGPVANPSPETPLGLVVVFLQHSKSDAKPPESEQAVPAAVRTIQVLQRVDGQRDTGTALDAREVWKQLNL